MKASGGYMDIYKMQDLTRQWKGQGFEVLVGEMRQVPGSKWRMPDFSGQVAKGAAFLDEKTPDWWRSIDTSALDLRNENMCILGQSWSHYKNAELLGTSVTGKAPRGSTNFQRFMNVLFGTTERERAAEYGFNISDKQGRLLNYQSWKAGVYASGPLFDLAFEHLTAEWLKIIRTRQEGVAFEGSEQIYAQAVARGLTHGAALQEVIKAAV